MRPGGVMPCRVVPGSLTRYNKQFPEDCRFGCRFGKPHGIFFLPDGWAVGKDGGLIEEALLELEPHWSEWIMQAEERLQELELELPPAPKAIGVYKSAILHGGLCYTSGHGPLKSDGKLITGVVGRDFTKEDGYAAARQTGLAILATLREKLGSLNHVKRVIKVFGMVQCTSDFDQQPAVINGCSELFRDVFGEDAGVGARSAVGMNALPVGMMVEIEAIFEVEMP